MSVAMCDICRLQVLHSTSIKYIDQTRCYNPQVWDKLALIENVLKIRSGRWFTIED